MAIKGHLHGYSRFVMRHQTNRKLTKFSVLDLLPANQERPCTCKSVFDVAGSRGSMDKPAGYRLYTEYRGIPDTVANGDFPPRLLRIAGQWQNLARDAAGRSGHPGLAAWRRPVIPGVIRNWFPGRAIGQDARQISRPRPRMSADQVVVRLTIGMISLPAIPFLLAFIGFALTSGASFGQ